MSYGNLVFFCNETGGCQLEASAPDPNTMANRLVNDRPSAIDVLDRILDKGIVIDGCWRMAVAGIDLISVDGRAVVASIETYLRYAPDVAYKALLRWPATPSLSRLMTEAPSAISSEPQEALPGPSKPSQHPETTPSGGRRAGGARRTSRARSGSKRRPY
jgi:hypothetical protein